MRVVFAVVGHFASATCCAILYNPGTKSTRDKRRSPNNHQQTHIPRTHPNTLLRRREVRISVFVLIDSKETPILSTHLNTTTTRKQIEEKALPTAYRLVVRAPCKVIPLPVTEESIPIIEQRKPANRTLINFSTRYSDREDPLPHRIPIGSLHRPNIRQ